jgi:hypothetical protein
VVALFADRIGSARLPDVMQHVEKHLPCDYCRGMEANVAKLPRLGWHERRILLLAPGPDEDSKVIDPPHPGRAADEVNRRAIRKLFNAGLLWISMTTVKMKMQTEYLRGGRWVPGERDYWKRQVRLTPLGQAVVRHLRQQLEVRLPIRWDRYRVALVAACREQPPELQQRLLARAQKEIGYIKEYSSHLGMGLAAGGKRE